MSKIEDAILEMFGVECEVVDDKVRIQVEHTCLKEYEDKVCPACILTKALEKNNDDEVEIHECSFYPRHRENGPRTFNIYCKQCCKGIPQPEEQEYVN